MQITIDFQTRWGVDTTISEARRVTIHLDDKDMLQLAREIGAAIGQALQAREQPEGGQHRWAEGESKLTKEEQ